MCSVRFLLGLLLLTLRCHPRAERLCCSPLHPGIQQRRSPATPKNYREWIYLSSGLGMNYGPTMAGMDHLMFDNVFVNPEAYHSFLETGTWPEKTVMVLENRGAEKKGQSIRADTIRAPT